MANKPKFEFEHNLLESQVAMDKIPEEGNLIFIVMKHHVTDNMNHFERYHNYSIVYKTHKINGDNHVVLHRNLLFSDAMNKIKNPDQLIDDYYDYHYKRKNKIVACIMLLILSIIGIYLQTRN